METFEVILNEGEVELAKFQAKRRTAAAREAGVVDKKIGDQDGDKAELDAFGAELAAAKFLNLYPDLSVGPRKGGSDLFIVSGKVVYGIDVKQTHYKKGRLLAPNWKTEEDSDIYMLVIGTMPEYTIIGWAWAKDLLQKINLRDMGQGHLGYALPQTKLKGFDDTVRIDRHV